MARLYQLVLTSSAAVGTRSRGRTCFPRRCALSETPHPPLPPAERCASVFLVRGRARDRTLPRLKTATGTERRREQQAHQTSHVALHTM